MNESIAAVAAARDTGLRSFLLGVYNRMGLALLLTALLAYAATVAPLRDLLFYETTTGGIGATALGWVAALGPIGLILLFGWWAASSLWASRLIFWGSAALFGLSMGSIVMQYTSTSLATTFLATSAAFGGLSLYGYTTKRNLGAMSGFMITALVGLLVTMVINMFVASSLLYWAISIAGVLIFSVLIAMDTQKMKDAYADAEGDDRALAIAGNNAAFSLYLDFLNLFLFLLRFMGVNVKND